MKLVGSNNILRFKASEKAFNKRVGARLEKARKAAALSRSYVGEQLGGIHETQVMRLEAGTTRLLVVTAYRMCQLYNIDMGELLK